jgi:hypothetical protein
MQKFSGGEWWTSINSDFGSPPMDGKTLKDLPTAHAELVAILPSPKPDPTAHIPNLGSYTKKPPGPKSRVMGPRRTSCGSFLDYGPYASFAPSFEGEGVEAGRTTLGETVWRWEERRRERQNEIFKPESIIEIREGVAEDVSMDNLPEAIMDGAPKGASNEDMVNAAEDGLEGLLHSDEIAIIKSALGTLELEDAVNELLERNRKALARLEELQRLRIGNQDNGLSEVEEGSEEWDIGKHSLTQVIRWILSVLCSPRNTELFNHPRVFTAKIIQRRLGDTTPHPITQCSTQVASHSTICPYPGLVRYPSSNTTFSSSR